MIYNYIIDFAALMKKIEVSILQEFGIKNQTIFRAFLEKKIPQKGTICFNEEEINFYIHGIGISYELSEIKVKYNFTPIAELGISFNKKVILEFIQFRLKKDISDDKEFDNLCEIGILGKLWGNDYYLKKIENKKEEG